MPWTTREGNPTASWEEVIGKAYQTRTQLAAFGFYNTSPLEYEYVYDMSMQKYECVNSSTNIHLAI